MRISDWSSDVCSSYLNRVNLKNALGQIEADRTNLHRGWLPLLVDALTASTLWHSDAGSGSHPPHLLSVAAVWKVSSEPSVGPLRQRTGFEPYPDNLQIFTTQERSEEHTSELQSLMRISYAAFCL